MIATPSVIVILMLLGIAFLLLGAVLTVVWRKDGMTWSEISWAGSDAAAHPQRYVKAERVSIVHYTNLAGVSLFLMGVLIAVWISVRRL